MNTSRAIEQMVNAYIDFRHSPRHTRHADKAARRFAKARRQALQVCKPQDVAQALERVGFV